MAKKNQKSIIIILVIIAVLIVLFLLIKSCTNSSNSSNQPSETNMTTSEESTQQPASSSNNGNTGSTGSDNAVKSFFDKLGTSVQYNIKYDIEINAAGKTTSATQTMTVKGKNVKIEIDSAQGKAYTYFVNEKTYSCTDAAGNTMCFELPSASTSQADKSTVDTNNDIRSNWQGYNLVPEGTKTIAGKVATCFGFDRNGIQGEYCLSSDGAPLYIKSVSSGSTTEMTALEYSNSVSDAEFTLPATPQQLPTAPQQIPSYP